VRSRHGKSPHTNGLNRSDNSVYDKTRVNRVQTTVQLKTLKGKVAVAARFAALIPAKTVSVGVTVSRMKRLTEWVDVAQNTYEKTIGQF
jgi:hypothetical protein